MSKRVFISGTSHGIGRLTALKLAHHGHRVFATMREATTTHAADAAALSAAASGGPGSITIYEMDCGADESVEQAVAQALADAGDFDAVVNNAGVTMVGLEETVTEEDLMFQLDINVIAPHRVLRAVLPSMRKRGEGLLVHVTGTLGRLVLPAMGAFCASKAAYEALAEAYTYELAPLGIDSTIVEPGFFPTGFSDRVEDGADEGLAGNYGAIADLGDRLGATLADMTAPPQAADPDQVATAITMLVNAKAGSRPQRLVLDPKHGALVTGINDAHTAAQTDFMLSMGLADLIAD